MTDYRLSADAEAKLIDIHNGLKLAMDAYIKNGNQAQGETILRQVEEQLSRLINSSKRVSDSPPSARNYKTWS